MNDKFDAYDLTQDEDEHDCWVVETEYDSYAKFCGACTDILFKILDFSDIIRCSLMFDGVYAGEASTIASGNAYSIYGLSANSFGPLFCADMEILKSDCWSNLIGIGSRTTHNN